MRSEALSRTIRSRVPLALIGRHQRRQRARSDTDGASWSRRHTPSPAAITAVSVPIRGRFRVNITARTVIRIRITGRMPGIAGDTRLKAYRQVECVETAAAFTAV